MMKFTAAVASLCAISLAGDLKIQVQDEDLACPPQVPIIPADEYVTVKYAHYYAPTIIYEGGNCVH